ncbi:hypothetical protein BAT02nite_34690 [Bacillus atrophaeus]|nr:hypothetical protein BAT02nite_34690 [Bacillus atrophaeus]
MYTMKKWITSLFLTAAILFGLMGAEVYAPQDVKGASRYDQVLYFPFSRYPETGDHIKDAVAAGHSDVCTIDRAGADERQGGVFKGGSYETGV